MTVNRPIFYCRMFIINKSVINKKSGNEYKYFRLVESIATDDSVKQRTVLYLGKLDLPKEHFKILSKLIEARIKGKAEISNFQSLNILADSFHKKYLQKLETASNKKIRMEKAIYEEVDINSTITENHRSFGSEFVLNSFWKKLKIGKLLSAVEFSNKEKAIAKALIFGRIISQGSELHTYNCFQNKSSLNEFPGYDLSNVGKDSFYIVGDLLFNSKSDIEESLRNNLKTEYSLKDNIYLYDLTNTYFETSKYGSKLAKFGKSKEKRYDCPLVTLALVVDKLGFPVHSEIYEGNKSEPKSFTEILESIIKLRTSSGDKQSNFSVIMDRGIATSDNISYLKDKKYSYFVIQRRNAVKDFKTEFADKSKFEQHKVSGDNRVFIRKIENEKTTQVLVYSTGKEKKEQAIIHKKDEHFIEDIEKLISSHKKGNIVRANIINQRIGRLKQKYGSIATRYTVKLKLDKTSGERVLSISYSLKKKENLIKKEFAGCYVIETDKKNYNAKEIWNTYMLLHKVESAFRSMKSTLGARPIYHQIDSRIKSHLFISVIAYAILHSVEYELQQKKYHHSWSKINEILSTHQRSSITFETKRNKFITTRISGNPEKEQQEIYGKLNLIFTQGRKIYEFY